MGESNRWPVEARVGFENKHFMRVVYWPEARNGSAIIQSRVELWNGAVAVALDEVNHYVYVVRQTRIYPDRKVITTELPGGGINPLSTPFETAQLELLKEAGVEPVDKRDWVQLYKEEGKHPINGLVWTEQHAFLLLRGKKFWEPDDSDIREVMALPLSQLIEMDDNDELDDDPLGGYALRRAQSWLQKYRPDLLT